VALSLASALLQALVAVAIVGVCAWLLNATAKTMCGAERAIEIASYGLIAAFGARLVWSKGGGFFRALQAKAPAPPLAMAHPAHAHHHHHDHVHDAHCGHSHGPAPAELAGPGGWRRGLGAIVAVGLRPCSGAILVLVFALAQGLFWAGVAATVVMALGTAITVAVMAVLAISAKRVARRLGAAREGGGALVMRGVEFCAAGLVLLLGIGLLAGYVAAERVTCF
jgi:nickel/cobalt exporter